MTDGLGLLPNSLGKEERTLERIYLLTTGGRCTVESLVKPATKCLSVCSSFLKLADNTLHVDVCYSVYFCHTIFITWQVWGYVISGCGLRVSCLTYTWEGAKTQWKKSSRVAFPHFGKRQCPGVWGGGTQYFVGLQCGCAVLGGGICLTILSGWRIPPPQLHLSGKG